MKGSTADSGIAFGVPFLKYIDSKNEATIIGPDLELETDFGGQLTSNQFI